METIACRLQIQTHKPAFPNHLVAPQGLGSRDVAFMERLRNLAQEALTWEHLSDHQRLVWAAALELDVVPVQEMRVVLREAVGSNVAGQLGRAAFNGLFRVLDQYGPPFFSRYAILLTENENESSFSALSRPPFLCRIAGAASLVPGASEHHAKTSRPGP